MSTSFNKSFNPVFSQLKESATIAINQHSKKLANEGKCISAFGFGESPFPVPEALQQALSEHTNQKQYASSQNRIFRSHLLFLQDSWCQNTPWSEGKIFNISAMRSIRPLIITYVYCTYGKECTVHRDHSFTVLILRSTTP